MEQTLEWVINQLKEFKELGYTKLRATEKYLIFNDEKHNRIKTENFGLQLKFDDWRKYYELDNVIASLQLQNAITTKVLEEANAMLQEVNKLVSTFCFKVINGIKTEIEMAAK